MGKPTGFLEYKRKNPPKRAVKQRINDYEEIEQMLSEKELKQQAARCMDCGVPSCHAFGCPLSNRIPDWNDLVYRGHWKMALEMLHSTNNFPEITGRICPAPCEAACTLDINQPAVNIRHIELQIVEKGWKEGWIVPQMAKVKSGKRVAIVGSGPAGLTAAQQLARKGHDVVVFEKDDQAGGLLRYGIPDFKLSKKILDRRFEQMKAEGVRFETEVEAGVDISPRFLMRSYDAIVLTAGATVARNIDLPGRDFQGIHFAMEFLSQQNRLVSGLPVNQHEQITAAGKHVVVIGGGDTGSDCVGTSRRQGAASITQIELLPKPPEKRSMQNPWPVWPVILRTSSSHEEGCERLWSVQTRTFQGEKGHVRSLDCVKLDWSEPDNTGRGQFQEIPGSEFQLKADLVLLAMGFIHVEHGPLIRDLDVALDERGCIKVDETFMTSHDGVFAAGDSVMGASLVVKAFHQGREAAEGVDAYLKR